MPLNRLQPRLHSGLVIRPHRFRVTNDDQLVQITYEAVLSGLLAGGVLAVVARAHRLPAVVAGGLATAAGGVAWNAMLRAAHGVRFFTDAPVVVLPASWQDTGSGVFALAAATLLLGVGVLPSVPARRVAGYAAACGAAAFLVDVYLY